MDCYNKDMPKTQIYIQDPKILKALRIYCDLYHQDPEEVIKYAILQYVSEVPTEASEMDASVYDPQHWD